MRMPCTYLYVGYLRRKLQTLDPWVEVQKVSSPAGTPCRTLHPPGGRAILAAHQVVRNVVKPSLPSRLLARRTLVASDLPPRKDWIT